MTLTNKTVVITGASRGIGKAIGIRLAKEGANIVILAKTTEPHPKLEGTIYSAAEEMEQAGGKALPIAVDIRDEVAVQQAAKLAADTFGGIDILVNNASAIMLADTMHTPMKRFDLMHGVNVRGTFVASQACLPYLLKSENPHVLNLSPPLSMETRWFAPHVAYSMAKFGMSFCVLGMSEEFREQGVAFNALWPKTAIATAAIENVLMGSDALKRCRKPEIMADAAFAIFQKNSRTCTGNFFIDEEVLRAEGVNDFSQYADVPDDQLILDFFVG
jgi:citronellol/citronellal dehydrogenase